MLNLHCFYLHCLHFTLFFLNLLFEERNIYVLLLTLRHVIHIPSFRLVNLLYCGGHSSNIYWCYDRIQESLSLERFLALLIELYKDVFGHPQVVSKERPQDEGRTRPLEVNIRQYGKVLITSAGDVLKTSVWDVPWRYI